MSRRRLRRSILSLNADSECYSRALSDETRSGPRIATFLGSDFFGPRLAEFHPERLCCQAEKMAEGLASPALLLSAHLGPCTGTCVPCARVAGSGGSRWAEIGRLGPGQDRATQARVRRGQGLMPPGIAPLLAIIAARCAAKRVPAKARLPSARAACLACAPLRLTDTPGPA